MTACLAASVTVNLILLAAALAQRFRQRAVAAARCERCPFVQAAAPVVRIPAPAFRTALPVLSGAP